MYRVILCVECWHEPAHLHRVQARLPLVQQLTRASAGTGKSAVHIGRCQQHSTLALYVKALTRPDTALALYCSIPIFPGLHSIAIQQIMQRFPVVVDLVAVVSNIESCTQNTGGQ